MSLGWAVIIFIFGFCVGLFWALRVEDKYRRTG